MLQSGGRPLTAEEQELFRNLYKIHYQALCEYAYRMGIGQDVAEDCVQDAFVMAIRHIEDIKKSNNPRWYLIQALKYVVGYQLRSMRYAVKLQKNLQTSLDQHNNESLANQLQPETLYRGAISNEELDLLIRFYLKGLSQKELAGEMAISENAVQQRIKRAKQHLRSALEEKPPGSDKPLVSNSKQEGRRTEKC